MKIEDLKLLSALFKEPNLTKISKRFHYSQSNLSKIIRRIEDELGFPLFHRKGFHGLEPTAQGLLLAERIQKFSNSWDETLTLVKTFDQGRIDLKVTGPNIYMRNVFLPNWFKSDLPQKYRLVYAHSRMDQLTLAAESGDLDIVITQKPYELEDWVPHPIFTEKFALICSAGRGAKSLKDLNLKEKMWVGYRSANEMFQQFLSQNQISPSQVLAYVEDAEGILDIIEANPDAATILPTHSVRRHRNLKVFPVSFAQGNSFYLMHRSRGSLNKSSLKVLKEVLSSSLAYSE